MSDLDVAAELRLIRAEITAIRTAPRTRFPGFDHAGRLVLPAKMTGKARQWLHLRARAGVMPHAKISRQRRLALWLTITAGIRTAVWLAAMGVVIAYAFGAGGTFEHWFVRLSGSLLFIAFLSYYACAATDASSLTASVAALFASDSHAAVVAAGVTADADFTVLESDIARLADLQPGPDATALADDIRHRLGNAA